MYLNKEIEEHEGQNDDEKERSRHADNHHSPQHHQRTAPPHGHFARQHVVDHIHILAEAIQYTAQRGRVKERQRLAKHSSQHVSVQVVRCSTATPG